MKDEASIWFESRKLDKDPYVDPEIINIDIDDNLISEQTSSDEELITDKKRRSEINLLALSKPTADIITSIIDSLIPVIFVIFLKDFDQNQLKLTPEEHETLSSAFANYLKDSNVQLSPGLVLIITIATIYGSKITSVLISVKEKKNEIELLKEQNILLKSVLEKSPDNINITETNNSEKNKKDNDE